MNPEIVIKKSKRKTISLTVTKNLEVLVRAPLKMPDIQIHKLILKHKTWVEKHLIMQKERNTNAFERTFSENEIKELRKKAKEIVNDRILHYSFVIGVTPANIKITSAVTKWGSCSAKNNLCFPYRISLLPIDLVDYIVVHELVHIKIKNHSKQFYSEVEKFLPDYKERIAKLKIVQRQLGI